MERENWVGYRPKVIIPEKKDSQKRRKENRKLERDIQQDWDSGTFTWECDVIFDNEEALPND